MSRAADVLAPPIYGVVDFAVIVAPATAFNAAADRGGLGDVTDLDLLAASVVLGAIHAVIAARRLWFEEHVAIRRTDLWIAAIDSLAVLALSATLLPLVVLWGFADEHASIADRGYPVVALWVGVLVTAIVAAEVTGRVVFRWLEEPTPGPDDLPGPRSDSCADRPTESVRS